MSRGMFNGNGRGGSRRMAARIATEMARVMPAMMAQIQQLTPVPITPVSQNGANPPQCTFKHFNSCNPLKFTGTEGATALHQWFESMENTFINSDCPENLKVRYGTSVFQKRALTWWNSEKRLRGLEVALALPWNEVKNLMRRQFCPPSETRKLEAEFWELKQEGGENSAYNERFEQLSDLVPHLVTPLSRAIEKYIGGLPMQIQDTVWGRDPQTLEAAMTLAGTLSDNHVKAGTLTKKSSKKSEKSVEPTPAEPPKEIKAITTSSNNHKKRKSNNRNYAVTTPITQAVPITQVAPITPPNKKLYTGNLPLCNTCKYHHTPNIPCRQCHNCGRYGHFANVCRQPVQNQQLIVQPVVPRTQAPPQQMVRACYHCGNPNHLRNACPQLVNANVQANQANQGNQVARGRTFNINANQAQANNEVVNDGKLLRDLI